MPYVELQALPQLLFAHSYGAETYANALSEQTDWIEVTYITRGHLSLEQDGHRFTASAGDVFSNLYRTPCRVQAEAPHEHHTVCFMLPVAISDQPQTGYCSLPLLTHTGESSSRVLALIDEIIRESTLHADRPLTCAGLFLQLLDQLSECAERDHADLRHSDRLYVDKAKKYIFDHLTQSIGQREIAQHLGITPGYLCSVFKRVEGVPLMHFVNRAKLEKVSALMQKERLKLYQAAELYGYSDANYVSRLYRKYFHHSISDTKRR